LQRVENEYVYLVAPFSELGLPLDEKRNLYSTSAQAFRLHTDGSNLRDAYDIVLLCCFRNDKPDYGISLLMSVDEILERLSPEAAAILQEPVFPFFYGADAILRQVNGEYRIQYNPERFSVFQEKHQVCLSAKQIQAVAALNQILVFDHVPHRFTLSPGQCLILNNHKVLHGRTALSERGKRLLKRIRIYRYGHVANNPNCDDAYQTAGTDPARIPKSSKF
jgi:hypothetical protein